MLKFIRSLLFLSFCAAGAAQAAGPQAYTQADFDALQKEGKPTLVMIHADWCPTCKAQAPIVSDLLKTPEYQGVNALQVDFDGQKDAVKFFKAQYQSTLIAFKGGKEVGRSTGDTAKASIAALLKKSL